MKICENKSSKHKRLKMAPNFSKNAILTGLLDYYCLVCEYHFQSEDEIALHIAKLTHKENLEKTCYDIEHERIRKIKQWYFCEFCNDLIKTKAKIRLHIAEDLHLINKFRQSLLRCDYGILAYGVIAISNSAWSGLCGGTCLICNCEYTDEKQHADESMHIINLIKNNIKCDAQYNIYRLIDATSFQCLTCNSLESITTINSHFTHDSHKKISANCRQTAKSLKTMAITKMLPANTELNTNNSTENIDLNANGSKTNIELNEKGSAENIELIAMSITENMEFNAKDSAENVESNEKVSSENNELNENNSAENIELKEKASSENMELNEKGSAENIELKAKNSTESELNVNKINKSKEGHEIKDSKQTKRKTSRNVNSNQNPINVKYCNIEEREKIILKVLKTQNYFVPYINDRMMCLICEWSIDASCIQEHLTESHHECLLKLHKERIQKLKNSPPYNYKTNESNENSNVDSKMNDKDISDDSSNILDSLEFLQKNSINVNFETNSVMCKKCSKSIDFNLKCIQMHINEHKSTNSADTIQKECGRLSKAEKVAKDASPQKPAENTSSVTLKRKKTENSPSQDDLEKFAKDNKLKYKPGGKDVFCEQCRTRVPFTLNNMREHINGYAHKPRDESIKKMKNTKV
ncbi:metacaspase-3-like isoform X2 [Colias croceus]|uniref:metacaspase-3-like isoform X2 n=1 Tax=Colias crocea TaxID=72248 RepID=UPI001E280CDD|nr:metacaspase-3-like isoform X2 [Colias croceus]